MTQNRVFMQDIYRIFRAEIRGLFRRSFVLLFYIDESQLPLDRSFFAVDEWGTGKAEVEFSWINMDRIPELELYPVNAKDLLKHYSSEVRHFVYKEQ